MHAENRTRSPSAAGAQGVPRSFGLANAVSQPISVQRLKPVPKLRLSDDESPFLAPPTLASVSARPRVSERGPRGAAGGPGGPRGAGTAPRRLPADAGAQPGGALSALQSRE